MRRTTILVVGVAASLLGSARADTVTETLTSAVKGSTVDIGFRYRFEAVDDDAYALKAWANTLRSRLTVATKPAWGINGVIEIDDVRHIGAENFNDTRDGVTDRPNVNDPEGTDVNQLYLRYSGLPGMDVRIGRQRILRANERFIGGVGWRQNEQTFDAAGITQKLFGDRLTLSYDYISKVHRIYGPEDGAPPAVLDGSSHLFDASYAFAPLLTLSGYWYLMDFSNAATSSNATAGVRATGALSLGDTWRLPYAAEYAHQSAYANNPVGYAADYYLAEAGIARDRVGLKVGYEVLGGSASAAGESFRTPLATLHSFQGWADKFLNTPDRGVRDLYVALTGKALGADLLLRFHNFQAHSGGGHWGTEIDGSANWTFLKHYGVLLKAASYDANDLAKNTLKYWVQLSANF